MGGRWESGLWVKSPEKLGEEEHRIAKELLMESRKDFFFLFRKDVFKAGRDGSMFVGWWDGAGGGVREELKMQLCWGAVGAWPWGRRGSWGNGSVGVTFNKRKPSHPWNLKRSWEWVWVWTGLSIVIVAEGLAGDKAWWGLFPN